MSLNILSELKEAYAKPYYADRYANRPSALKMY